MDAETRANVQHVGALLGYATFSGDNASEDFFLEITK